MADDYYITLEKYSLGKFKEDLKESELIPSRKILKEQIDEKFKILGDNCIHNLQDLTLTLKTPQKTKEFSNKSNLSQIIF